MYIHIKLGFLHAKQFFILSLLRCSHCEEMSVYKCYDCSIDICTNCFGKHNDDNKDPIHVMQPFTDSFIINCKFSSGIDFYGLTDMKCLSNGMFVATSMNVLCSKVMTFLVSGKRLDPLQFSNENSCNIAIIDENTLAFLMSRQYFYVAIVQQGKVGYIQNKDLKMDCENHPFIFIKKHFYVCDKLGIAVVDMSGTVIRRIDLSFTTSDMCYDVDSRRFYCLDSANSKLICIDRYGNDIFTFADPNIINLTGITIDKEGNVLVLRINREYAFGSVIKVDSNGKSSDVVISNIRWSKSYMRSCICFHHSSNSVAVGVSETVYIYKKKANM